MGCGRVEGVEDVFGDFAGIVTNALFGFFLGHLAVDVFGERGE